MQKSVIHRRAKPADKKVRNPAILVAWQAIPAARYYPVVATEEVTPWVEKEGR
jgi:hypothetical protein